MSGVSSVTFQYVLKALEMKTKISTDEMLEHIKLDSNIFEQNQSIKSYQLSAIFRYCMDRTNNKDLALELGGSISYQSLGLLGYLLLNTQNLKEMIEKFSTYQKLISNHLKFNFFDEEGYYKFAIYINENRYIPVPSFHVEVHLSAILSILSQILGERVNPDKSCFAYSQQDNAQTYEKLFGQTIHYEQDENAIFFDKNRLNKPVKNANPTMLSFFENEANTLLSENENNSYFYKVEKEILKNIGDEEISAELIASNLGLSVRTMQNYLKEESKSFSLALCNVRKNLCKYYLQNTKLDDHALAIFLGYREISSFYRAFKKWYGTTPKQFKNALKNRS